jgi:hypothetical protein
MAPSLQPYSFLRTVLLVNGVQITGWPEGDDVIEVSRRTDSASMKVGCGGDGVLSLSADRSGEFKFKLQGTSSSNAYLSSLLAQQENGAASFQSISVLVQDFMLNDMAQGSNGFINKPSPIKRGKELADNEWTITVVNLNQVYGGE